MLNPIDHRMHTYLRSGDSEGVKMCLREGANPNSLFGTQQMTALGFIVTTGFHNKAAIVKMLLDAKANPNLAGDNGITPLHETAQRGWDVEVATLLIDGGANVNAQTKSGYTPLHFAVGSGVASGNTRVLELLLSRGADTALKTTDGKTIMDIIANPPGLGNNRHLVLKILAPLEAQKKMDRLKEQSRKKSIRIIKP